MHPEGFPDSLVSQVLIDLYIFFQCPESFFLLSACDVFQSFSSFLLCMAAWLQYICKVPSFLFLPVSQFSAYSDLPLPLPPVTRCIILSHLILYNLRCHFSENVLIRPYTSAARSSTGRYATAPVPSPRHISACNGASM